MTDMADLGRRMDGAVSSLHQDFAGLRTGRAATGMLESLDVEVYGSTMPLNQLANINAPEPRLLSVQVWDANNPPAVEKAIRNSDLGLNPQAEGTLIRVPVPELSEERRKELAKVAGKYAEQARIAVRNVRRDGMDSLKKEEKDGDISEDDQRRLGDEIQKMTDQHIKKIDEMLDAKEKDILSV
ncbi:MAG: ribosome recycling factor [Rickettsiales bacterium]|nr:ribosome recycling factor [Rickettsiales bacterium]